MRIVCHLRFTRISSTLLQSLYSPILSVILISTTCTCTKENLTSKIPSMRPFTDQKSRTVAQWNAKSTCRMLVFSIFTIRYATVETDEGTQVELKCCILPKQVIEQQAMFEQFLTTSGSLFMREGKRRVGCLLTGIDNHFRTEGRH